MESDFFNSDKPKGLDGFFKSRKVRISFFILTLVLFGVSWFRIKNMRDDLIERSDVWCGTVTGKQDIGYKGEKIIYEYTIDNVKYESRQSGFLDWVTKGKQYMLLYDPDDPSLSYLIIQCPLDKCEGLKKPPVSTLREIMPTGRFTID